MAHYQDPMNSVDGLGVSLHADDKVPDNEAAVADSRPPCLLPLMFISGNQKAEVSVAW
jgi:hypothetical protein